MTQLHPRILGTLPLRWADEAACAASATALARGGAAQLGNAVIELDGPLGAGKTTFARHLLRALGVRGTVKSPTYAVVEPYEVNGMRVAHFDFYRFDDPQEWEDAGLRDEFGAAGLKIVEWAAKAAPLLPLPDLRLVIGSWDDSPARSAHSPLMPQPTRFGAAGRGPAGAVPSVPEGVLPNMGDEAAAREVLCEAYTPHGMLFIEALKA